MIRAKIDEAMQTALQHHQAGRLAQAEALYRQVLSENPRHPDALHLLGVIAMQVGPLDAAIELIRQAIEMNPNAEAYYSNLGSALHKKGQLDEALTCLHQALWLRPDYPDAHNNLGAALRDKGDLDAAIASFRQAVRLQPRFASAHSNLGNALQENDELDAAIESLREAVHLQPTLAPAHYNLAKVLDRKGELDAAIASYRQAIHGQPRFPEAHNNLGKTLRDKGDFDAAIASCREALRLRQDFPEAHNNLGDALAAKGELDAAIACFRDALRLRPEFALAHFNLATCLFEKGELDAAVSSFNAALRLQPNHPDVYNNLGNAFKDSGQLDEAIDTYRQAIAINPNFPAAHSNLIYTLHFHPDYDAKAIFEEASRWSQRHAAPLRPQIQPHKNDRNPDRPLRIGYVSSEFRAHPLADNFLPLALSHDRARFAFVCYSGGRKCDAVTERLRALANEWRETANLPDAQLAELVRRDTIDILVDLGVHMANNRLLVFARKPAPVQVTMLCSMGTTGLPTIDYRISDQYSDPPNFNDAYYAEETVRLPDCYFCHEVPPQSPPVNPLPAARGGHITFGSINNFCKVTPQVLHLWGRILQAVPHSQLILRCTSREAQKRVLGLMSEMGITADRIEFVDQRLDAQAYLRLHHRIDIYLDPFPYGGHTTSLDALWMGVPLITLAGRTDVGRAGVFLLTNLDMTELIAQSEEQYAQKAVELAGDLPRLAYYRGALRDRMLKSPLLDTERFTRNVETAYRQMWRAWCKSLEMR